MHNTILKTFAISFILLSINCQICKVYDVQELNGLKNNKSVVAFVKGCGATVDRTLHLSWKKSNTELEDIEGNIFKANHGSKIEIKKISTDTVQVYYFAREIITQKDIDEGITFLYEVKNLEFFEH